MDSAMVCVVDYGFGNIFSVTRALEQVGARVVVSRDPERILAAGRVVLPGVGAFGDCMDGLRRYGLDRTIGEVAAAGRPLLGICVGMQVMFEVGEEFGEHAGLGLIPGRVTALRPTDEAGRRIKLPHIGWAALTAPPGRRGEAPWAATLLEETEEGATFYFVHSYQVVPREEGHRLADTLYHGQRVTAAVCRENIVGFQFHPEKSGENGLRVLRRFVEWDAAR